MSPANQAKPDSTAVLRAQLSALLRGQASAGAEVANTLRADAFGLSTFGRTDALDLFAARPLVLSAAPHVLVSSQAMALVDDTPDGRCVGVFADLADGVIARLWVVAASAADAPCEAGVPVACDDFMSQLRLPCQGDAVDHPELDADAWPDVLSLGTKALAAAAEPSGASSSQAIVMRAFSVGGPGGTFAALYQLRLQEDTAPRRAHRRLALATARRDAKSLLVHSQLALSDPLPAPTPVFFSSQ